MMFQYVLTTLLSLQLLTSGQAQDEQQDCISALRQSDVDGNGRVDQEDYVKFLNILLEGQYSYDSYMDLPLPLIMNYEIYEEYEEYDDENGTIDVTGLTSPDTASRKQKRIVEALCETIVMAVDAIPMSQAIPNNSTYYYPLDDDYYQESTSVPTENDDLDEDESNELVDGDDEETFVAPTEQSDDKAQAETTDEQNTEPIFIGDNSATVTRPGTPVELVGDNTATVTRPGAITLSMPPAQVTEAPATLRPTLATTNSPSRNPTATPTTSSPTASPTTTPSTLAPSSLAPTSLAPTSLAPTSVAPSSSVPVTESPSTATPSTVTTTISPSATAITASPSTTAATATPSSAPTVATTTASPSVAATTLTPTAATTTLEPTAAVTALVPDASNSTKASEMALATVDAFNSTNGIDNNENPIPTAITNTSEVVNSSELTSSSSNVPVEGVSTTTPPNVSFNAISSPSTIPTTNNTTEQNITSVESETSPVIVASQLPSNTTKDEDSASIVNDTTNHIDPSSPTAASTPDPNEACKVGIQFSDIDQDEAINKIEYVWFINDNWNNPYPGFSFGELPQRLRNNFERLAIDDEIDISFFMSGEALDETQKQTLNRICIDTNFAVEKAQAHSSYQSSEGGEASMNIFRDCLESVAKFDANTDGWLDRGEFSAFIGEMSNGSMGGRGFHRLPIGIRDTFNDIAFNHVIDLAGATPEATLTASQQEILENICIEVSYALDKAMDADGQGEMFDQADTDTMLEYGECFLGMTSHDKDENSKLDKDEYVGLVNHLGKNKFEGLIFDDLPSVLRDNFEHLATDGFINTKGARSEQVSTASEQQFLGQVCIDTTASVNLAIYYMDKPSETTNGEDTPSNDAAEENSSSYGEDEAKVTENVGAIVIHSAFNVYSEVWVPDEEFQDGPTRQYLEEAFHTFVSNVVKDLQSTEQQPERGLEEQVDDFFIMDDDAAAEEKDENEIEEDQSQVEENLRDEDLIRLDPDSSKILRVVDLNCAAAIPEAICKTVYAEYAIIPLEGMNATLLYREYVMATQRFIDSGLLQEALSTVIDPDDTFLAIIGASEPAIYTPSAVTKAPTLPINTETDASPVDDMTEGLTQKQILALAAVGVGFLLGLSVLALIVIRCRRRLHQPTGSTVSGSGADTSSLGKVSETESKEDEFREEGSSQAGSSEAGSSDTTPNSSNIHRHSLRHRFGAADSSDDDDEENFRDEEIGKMQLIDLDAAMQTAGTTSVNDTGRNKQNGNGGNSFVPPLWRRKEGKPGELNTASSEEISFAFRRYALDGSPANPSNDGSVVI